MPATHPAPTASPVTAVLRHKLVLVVCALIGVAAGVALATARSPVFSSTALLSAGRLEAQAQALPGFAEAAKSLAATYSRIATSDAVAGRVARVTRVPLDEVRDRLSVTPVPGSPVIRLRAEGPSAASARALADVTSRELEGYVADLAVRTGAGGRLLDRYRDLTAKAEDLRREMVVEQRRLGGRGGQAGSRRLTALRVEHAAAQLRAQTTASIFAAQREDASGAATITVLSAASPGQDDESSVLQRFAIAGVLGGLLVGFLAALLVERRRLTRLVR